MRKESRISVRISHELRQQLDETCTLTNLDEPTIVRACLTAFIEQVKAEGGIWLPLKITPKFTGHPGK
jgi:predicted DNA-binding protein